MKTKMTKPPTKPTSQQLTKMSDVEIAVLWREWDEYAHHIHTKENGFGTDAWNTADNIRQSITMHAGRRFIVRALAEAGQAA